jgi:hypothetical protein
MGSCSILRGEWERYQTGNFPPVPFLLAAPEPGRPFDHRPYWQPRLSMHLGRWKNFGVNWNGARVVFEMANFDVAMAEEHVFARCI